MRNKVLNLRYRNLISNVLVGALFMLTGIFRILGIAGPVTLTLGMVCIAALLLSIYASNSRDRELKDEMYWSNAGKAAFGAFIADAILFCCIGATGLFTGASVDLCGAAYFALGLTEFTNGVLLARLEGSSEYADD